MNGSMPRESQILNRHLLTLLALLVLALHSAQAKSQIYFGHVVESTLCKENETIMFACNIKKKKFAVCSSPRADNPFGVLQYRFGSSSQSLDLAFPSNDVPAQASASGGSRGNMGRGSMQFLRMKNADVTYTVYHDAFSSSYGREDGTEGGGILIERAGKLLANKQCEADQVIYSGMLQDERFFGPAIPIDKTPVTTFESFGY